MQKWQQFCRSPFHKACVKPGYPALCHLCWTWQWCRVINPRDLSSAHLYGSASVVEWRGLYGFTREWVAPPPSWPVFTPRLIIDPTHSTGSLAVLCSCVVCVCVCVCEEGGMT